MEMFKFLAKQTFRNYRTGAESAFSSIYISKNHIKHFIIEARQAI